MKKRVRFAQPESSYNLQGDDLKLLELFDCHVQQCWDCYDWIYKMRGNLCEVGYEESLEVLELVKVYSRQQRPLKIPSHYSSTLLLIDDAQDGRYCHQPVRDCRNMQEKHTERHLDESRHRLRLLTYVSGGAVLGGMMYGLVRYRKEHQAKWVDRY